MPQIDEDADIVLDNVTIHMVMDDHVHTSFCQQIEREQVAVTSKNTDNPEFKDYVKQCTLITVTKKHETEKRDDWVEVSATWQLDDLPESLGIKDYTCSGL